MSAPKESDSPAPATPPKMNAGETTHECLLGQPGDTCTHEFCKPSAGTEQKERGEPSLVKQLSYAAQTAFASCCPDSTAYEAGLCELEKHFAAILNKVAAPTDGTTTPRKCPVCDNDGFWVDVQPNQHTGDAEQVQVECEFCSMKASLALAEKRLGEAQKKQPINTHMRLWDLVRYARAELHEDNLITDQEYADLCVGTKADQKLPGSPSPRRLEDYDDIRAQLAASQARLVEVEKERDAANGAHAHDHEGISAYSRELFGNETMGYVDGLRKIHSLRSALAQAKQEKEDAEKWSQTYIEEARTLRAANTALQEQVRVLTGERNHFEVLMNDARGHVHQLRSMLREAGFPDQVKWGEDLHGNEDWVPVKVEVQLKDALTRLAALSAQVEELKRDGEMAKSTIKAIEAVNVNEFGLVADLAIGRLIVTHFDAARAHAKQKEGTP